VILLSEGIAAKFPEDELTDNCGASIKYDDYGNIRVSEIELGKIIKNEVENRLARRGEKITLVETSIGYTLRCAAPIPFDCEYVRDLGYAAVHFLVSPQFQNQHSALICVDAGKLVPIELEEMIDPKTGKTKIRYVDIHTDSYAVAQEYMIKLKREDFAEPENLLSLVKAAQMTPEAFRDKFEYLVK
jgi:6-phosphofructokinase 1